VKLINKDIYCTLRLNNKEIERILEWYEVVKRDYEMGSIGLEEEDTELYNHIRMLTGIEIEEKF
jgi:hypothetical protein